MNLYNEEIVIKFIKNKDIENLKSLIFINDSKIPIIKDGYKTETEFWDYKESTPTLSKDDELDWAEIARDILGFYNNKGGLLIFGINDKSYKFVGNRIQIDSKLLNDKVRKYIGDRIWIDYCRTFVQEDQSYLGIALIPGRSHSIARFQKDSPLKKSGKHLFQYGYSAIRKGDSTFTLDLNDTKQFEREHSVLTLGKIYEIDEPCFRILAPEYHEFIYREELCKKVISALEDPRTAIASLVGIGGIGKTATATWATMQMYEKKKFEFIVSITAKDRELTNSGLQALTPSLTSFESLLDNILEILGFPEFIHLDTENKEVEVRNIMKDLKGLLYVDNLETVDDSRIIAFLDSLPVGIRAITTSRRSRVKVSVNPIEVFPLNPKESVNYIKTISRLPGYTYINSLSNTEVDKITQACDGIPLAIRWALANAQNALEINRIADEIISSGKRREELLEFSFRRVYDKMTDNEKVVLKILSIFNGPVSSEVLVVGSKLPIYTISDILEDLIADAIVYKLFDKYTSDYLYTILPITRDFLYKQVELDKTFEKNIRMTLNNWYEAVDIQDLARRQVTSEIRKGINSNEDPLLDLAKQAEDKGESDQAKRLYLDALNRNPKSWKAHRLYGEFCRHKLQNTSEALNHYEQAAANSPKKGIDKALIFREWGMILRNSGESNSVELSINKFEIALEESPNDEITIHALSSMYYQKGYYEKAKKLLLPLLNHKKTFTKRKTIELLIKVSEAERDVVQANIYKIKLNEL